MAGRRSPWILLLLTVAAVSPPASADGDGNGVYSPCEDSKVKRMQGFTLGLALASRESFYSDGVELSPCDSRLGLANRNANLAVFRPYVDEISLLSVNLSNLGMGSGLHMVAFAGRKYAARSLPEFVGNDSYIITSFTLVLEFQTGTLQNFYWKKDGCSPCSHNNLTCVNDSCAIPTSRCSIHDGPLDCSVGIQVAFSGTDRYDAVLNSWYEVSKIRQYSLFSLFSDLKDSIASQFGGFFG